MSTQTIFDKLVGRKRQREQALLSSYKQLVEAIANETEPDPEEVERMLAESDKTLDDLQADCAKLSRRMRLKASLDRRPARQSSPSNSGSSGLKLRSVFLLQPQHNAVK